MEFLFLIPVILIPYVLPVIAGMMAQRFGRRFWFWFWVSSPLPGIVHVVLLCLPDKSKPQKPVENHELFNHLFN